MGWAAVALLVAACGPDMRDRHNLEVSPPCLTATTNAFSCTYAVYRGGYTQLTWIVQVDGLERARGTSAAAFGGHHFVIPREAIGEVTPTSHVALDVYVMGAGPYTNRVHHGLNVCF